MKKLSRYFCFSLLLMVIACTPRQGLKAPPVYEGLSPEDISLKIDNDIDILKAITEISVEKNKEPYDFINASVLVKKPGWVHMRMYKFGMLVKDIVIKDDMVYVLAGKSSDRLKQLASEFYNAIIWWDILKDGLIYSDEDEFIIRTDNKQLHLDRKTLLPVKQQIKVMDKIIQLSYSAPVETDGFWYPSVITISAGEFTFSVTLKKIVKNPVLGEFDFQTPSES